MRCRQQNEEIFEFAKANNNGIPEAVKERQNDMVSTMIRLLHAISEKLDERIVNDGVYHEMRGDTDSNTVDTVPSTPFLVPSLQQMNDLWHRELIETQHGLIESDWRTLER